MFSSTLLLLGLIGLVGFACQWLAWRVKLPAILFLLLSGILLGPVLDVFDPDAIFGELLFPMISLAVAIILFEGSLTLRREELHDIGRPVVNMVTYGIVINGVITTLAAHYFVGLDWSIAALFGAVMVVTGPTVIMPMLKATRLNRRLSKVLRWEGIVIDPIGALMAVLIFELILSQQEGTGMLHIAALFGSTVLVGCVAGAAAAWALGVLLRRHWIPEYLQNFASLAFVCGTFALSDTLKHESGLIAVTVMGVVLANMRGVYIQSILNFKEHLTTVFVSVLFIVLAARIDFEAFAQLGLGAVAVFLTMQFVARPAKVFACTINSGFSFAERLMLAWVGPRGIVAAAVCAAFALRLEQAGNASAYLLVPLSFTIIIGTVLLQGTTARVFARWLDVAEPANKGALIIGSNPVSIAIAKALGKLDVASVICDTHWESLSAARMEGLRTYYGNPMSNHAELYLDKTGLGEALGLSFNNEKNDTAALWFMEEYGRKHVYRLAAPGKNGVEQKHGISDHYQARTLFGKDVNYGVLAGRLSRGAKIRSTTLTDGYTLEDWQRDTKAANGIWLLALDKNQVLFWVTADSELNPDKGWQLMALVDVPEAQ